MISFQGNLLSGNNELADVGFVIFRKLYSVNCISPLMSLIDSFFVYRVPKNLGASKNRMVSMKGEMRNFNAHSHALQISIFLGLF